MIIFLLLLLVIHQNSFAFINQSSRNDSYIVRIPLSLHNQDKSVTEAVFEFDILKPYQRLEFEISEFCERYNIKEQFSKQLYSIASEQAYQLKLQLSSITKLWPNLASTKDYHDLTSPHIMKHANAIRSVIRFEQSFHRINLISEGKQLEEKLSTRLFHQILALEKHILVKRLVFIHSILFPNQSPRILEEILEQLLVSGLYYETDSLIILHYGIPLPSSLFTKYPRITIVYVSSDTSYFELLSFRIICLFAKKFIEKNHLKTSYLTSILYLHTLGQSYRFCIEGIEHWREMMLFFLVTKYQNCLHLINSHLFDIIGTNYQTNPRHFHGNYWWTTLEYLSQVNIDIYLAWKTTTKIDLQTFLFQSNYLRIYSFHNSDINYYEPNIQYPWYCYRSAIKEQEKEEIQGIVYEKWSKICQNNNHRNDFWKLHEQNTKQSSMPFIEYREDFIDRPSKSECKGLELTSVVET
jgi:hypothetical protein